MAYNNGFQNTAYGMGYFPQYFPQPMPNQQIQQPQIQQVPQTQQVQQQQPDPRDFPVIWVQGISGANNFFVAPNAIVPLWDSEAPIIYWKSADASGKPNIKILDYTVREVQHNGESPVSKSDITGVNYATKEDIELIRKELNRCISRINNIDSKKERKE